jgi:hypothetical protein
MSENVPSSACQSPRANPSTQSVTSHPSLADRARTATYAWRRRLPGSFGLLRIIAVSHTSEVERGAAQGGNPGCDTSEHFAVTAVNGTGRQACFWSTEGRSVLAQEHLPHFTRGIEDQDVAGHRVRPPPTEPGVERQAKQYRPGQQRVDESDPAFRG